jgi:hypothetical protein
MKRNDNTNFIWVRCSDKKTATAVQPTRPPEVIFFDCDGEKIGNYPVSDVASLDSAMDKVLTKYANKEISWGTLTESTCADAKDSKKLMVFLFSDDKKDSEETAKALEDRNIAKHHEKLVFVKVAYDKDNDDCKRFGVTSAPTVMIVDPTKELGSKAVMDKLVGKQKPMALRSLILKGFEKMKAAEKR